jgi:N-acetylglucosaminyldiphosphoundecaprenol N-acetyl-beta-D-mannosaminyltransferase
MPQANATVKIIGVDMFVGSNSDFTESLIESVNKKESFQKNRLISATSAHGMVWSNQNSEFKKIISAFYLNLPDGQPTAWIGWLKGFKKMERCPGVGLFDTVMRNSASHSIQHFFCGGKEGVAIALKESVAKDLGNKNVAGTYSPPFRPMNENEWKALGEMIDASGANIVWIGLSTPKQEQFAYTLSNYCKVDYILTVGAVFDFFTGNLSYAPLWIRNMGLEWLYRLIKEPRRLFGRYINIVPSFIWLNLKEFSMSFFSRK